MTFGQSIRKCFGVYNTLLAGRASRSEFWWFQVPFLAIYVIAFVLTAMIVPGLETGSSTAIGSMILLGVLLLVADLYAVAAMIPAVAVLVRRLHDTGRSGWWYWIAIVPLIGWIILLIFLVQKGTNGANPYGSDPSDQEAGSDGGEGLTSSSIPSVGR